MKRCPECSRDYYDETLLYCLDDGSRLLEGTGSVDEPATAILHSTPVASEARTKPQIKRSVVSTAEPAGFDKRFVVAPLPFINASGNPDVEYLSDGMTDTLISSLSKLPNLNVKARSSVFRYKGEGIDLQKIARELNVQAILSGRVVQRGDNLTVSIELVNTATENAIWSENYSRKIGDVFAVQEEIANDISEKLRLTLTSVEKEQFAKRHTENLKAFQYHVQGRSYIHRRTRDDLLTAIRFFEKAIEEDRNYALAYTGLAEAYANLGVRGHIPPNEGRSKADEAARKALALDENLAEAHFANSLAHVLFPPHDFQLVDRELRRAIELSPSLGVAHFYLGVSLMRQGQLDKGFEKCLIARELDPLSSIIARQIVGYYLFKRDYIRALEHLRQANKLGPAFVNTWEVGVYIQNRLFEEALAELEKAKRERKDDLLLVYSTGMIYAARGERAEAIHIIKELEEKSGASHSQAPWIAKIYAVLDEKELALTWLERGLAAGTIGAFYKDEPVWDTIRSSPRFAELLRRMSIPV